MSPLLADFIQNRVCKPICEKFLTLPSLQTNLRKILDTTSRLAGRVISSLRIFLYENAARSPVGRRLFRYIYITVNALTSVKNQCFPLLSIVPLTRTSLSSRYALQANI